MAFGKGYETTHGLLLEIVAVEGGGLRLLVEGAYELPVNDVSFKPHPAYTTFPRRP